MASKVLLERPAKAFIEAAVALPTETAKAQNRFLGSYSRIVSYLLK